MDNSAKGLQSGVGPCLAEHSKNNPWTDALVGQFCMWDNVKRSVRVMIKGRNTCKIMDQLGEDFVSPDWIRRESADLENSLRQRRKLEALFPPFY